MNYEINHDRLDAARYRKLRNAFLREYNDTNPLMTEHEFDVRIDQSSHTHTLNAMFPEPEPEPEPKHGTDWSAA